jgi:guanylate kinase
MSLILNIETSTSVCSVALSEGEEVYTDKYYGTLKSEVERILNEGDNVIFDVDVVGGDKSAVCSFGVFFHILSIGEKAASYRLP